MPHKPVQKDTVLKAIACLVSNDLTSFVDIAKAYRVNVNMDIDPFNCDNLVLEFTRLHSVLATEDGTQTHPMLTELLNTPLLSHCCNDINRRINHLKHTNAVNLNDKNTYMLILAYSMMAYTTCNFHIARDGMMMVTSHLSKCDKNNEELQKRLALCEYHLGEYEAAVRIFPGLLCAWELLDPTAPEAFRARIESLERQSHTQNSRRVVAMKKVGRCVFSNDSIVCYLTENKMFGGMDSVVYDDDCIYCGNRETASTLHRQNIVDIPEAIIIPATNIDNFYHALIEFGARFLAFIRFATKSQVPNDAPIYVFNASGKVPSKLLEIAKMVMDTEPMSRRYRIVSSNSHMRASKLWIVDSVKNQYQPACLWDAYLPSPTAICDLRTCLSKYDRPVPLARRFVYAARRWKGGALQHPHRMGGVRCMENDDELVRLLSQWCSTENLVFTLCDGADTVHAQRQMYSNAKIIWGVHGAGLSNMIWAPLDCHIFEVGIRHKANKMFERMSDAIGLVHHYVCGLECEYNAHMKPLTLADLNNVQASLDDSK